MNLVVASAWPVLDNPAGVEVAASVLEVLMDDNDPVSSPSWASCVPIGFRTA